MKAKIDEFEQQKSENNIIVTRLKPNQTTSEEIKKAAEWQIELQLPTRRHNYTPSIQRKMVNKLNLLLARSECFLSIRYGH